MVEDGFLRLEGGRRYALWDVAWKKGLVVVLDYGEASGMETGGLTTKCKMGTRSDMAPAIPFRAESSPTPKVAMCDSGVS